MVHAEGAEMAAVSSDTSHVRTKRAVKSCTHSFRAACDKSAESLLESGK